MTLYRATIAKAPTDPNPLATDDKLLIRAVNEDWARRKLQKLGYDAGQVKKVEEK